MTLSTQTVQYHELYENETQEFRDAIDEAFTAAYESLQNSGYIVSNDDRAEELLSALVRYVMRSEENISV